MICPSCGHTEGDYQEVEDIDHECNYVYYTLWWCDSCYTSTNQWDSGFEWLEGY